MTKQAIIEAFTNAVLMAEPSKGLNDELSASENTTVTDAGANVLETVNPTHDYPPVLK